MDLSFFTEMAVGFVTSHPQFAAFCTVAYPVGIALKLIRETVEAYVAKTPDKSDDEKLAKVEASIPFKAIAFVLDVLFRFKKPEA